MRILSPLLILLCLPGFAQVCTWQTASAIEQHIAYGADRVATETDSTSENQNKYTGLGLYEKVATSGRFGDTDERDLQDATIESYRADDRILGGGGSISSGAATAKKRKHKKTQFKKQLKNYEISNHLGNVLVNTSDLKQGEDKNADNVTEVYWAEVKEVNDYYPFGMQMHDRSKVMNEVNAYRFGFQDQEVDNEVQNTNNSVAFKYRMYDSRLASFSSVDPLHYVISQSNKSPYASFWGNPILFIDPDGRKAESSWDYDISLSTGSGGLKVGLSVSGEGRLSFTEGDLAGGFGSISGELNVTYHSNFYGTGKSGLVYRASAKNTLGYKKYDVSLGTNFWRGDKTLDEFDQQTGMLGFNIGKFNAMYENDGAPFWHMHADNMDSYRTAAIKAGWGDEGVQMKLFTGRRDHESFWNEDNRLPGGKMGIPEPGMWGETYTHGFVDEKGPKYRFGSLTFYNGGLSRGVNSEWVRHAMQNRFAHDILNDQRQFQMTDGDIHYIEDESNQGSSDFTIYK